MRGRQDGKEDEMMTTTEVTSSSCHPLLIMSHFWPASLELADEAVGRLDDEIPGELNRLSTKSADGLHDLQQISAIAGAWAAAAVVVALVQVIDAVRARVHAQALDHVVEDLLVDVALGGVDFHLVANAAEEGVVDQILGVEVGRKDDELLEWDLELLAGSEREEVVAIFERQDPAIEQLLGTAQLAAEVVDEKDAAVGLDVQRCLVEVGLGVIAKVEHLQVEFAAGDNDGAADADPTGVDGAGVEQAADGGLVVLEAVAAVPLD